MYLKSFVGKKIGTGVTPAEARAVAIAVFVIVFLPVVVDVFSHIRIVSHTNDNSKKKKLFV